VTRIGRFELLGVLGRGGMGTVHRVRDGASGREVALKVVRTGDASRASRLVREAELARRLDHPGIVPVLDGGRDGDVVFVAFELVEAARPLDEVMTTLAPPARAALVRDVARALGHAHARGVVHRDVKAANVLVDAAGRARLTDFGIGTAGDLDRLTRSGMIIGTPRGMAPEQAMSARDRVGPPTDVWALGVVLHEALTGEHPLFGQDEPESLLAAVEVIVTRTPRGPRDVDPTVSGPLDAVVRRALAREPAERFPDGEAMAAALDRALAAPGARARLRRRGRGPLVALAGLAALVLVGGVLAWRARGERDTRAAKDVIATPAEDPARAFEDALARGDLEAAARGVEAGGPGAGARLAQAYLERARTRAAAAPDTAALDLGAALRLDPACDARAAALEVAFAHSRFADDAALSALLAPLEDDVAGEAWLVAAVGLERRGELVRARAARERALERASSPALRGEALVRLERAGAATTLLRPLADDPRVGARARLWLAAARRAALGAVPGELTDDGRRELVALFDDVLARDPGLFEAWLWRGLSRGELGDPGAVGDLERACAVAPSWLLTQAWQVLGYANIRLGRWADAVRALDRALALDEENGEARKQRGIARLRAGDLRGAVDDLQRLADGPDGEHAEPLHALVEARVALGETTGVHALVTRLRRLAPSPPVDIYCADALANAGDGAGAEDLLAAHVGEDTEAGLRGFALFLRCRVRLERGDEKGACADADLVASLAPSSRRAHAAVALTRLALGEVVGAGVVLRQAVGLPEEPEGDAWLRLADAWLQHATGGDLDRALASLDQVLAAPGPPWGLALALRARVRAARGDLEGARADARALLARLTEAPRDAWTARVAREVLGS
jgi:serine/threonine-protein kinase